MCHSVIPFYYPSIYDSYKINTYQIHIYINIISQRQINVYTIFAASHYCVIIKETVLGDRL